jgi:FkbM family methyltransferase
MIRGPLDLPDSSETMSRISQVPRLADVTAFERHRANVEAALSKADRLVIFGAGQNGRMVASLLRRHGLEPAAFFDDTPHKIDTFICGLQVEQVPLVQPNMKTTVICSIFSARSGFLPIQRRLRALSVTVVSLFELLWCLGENFLPFYFLDHPRVILDNFSHIEWFASQLVDERSQRELLSHVNFRLRLDYDELGKPEAREVGPPLVWDNVIYIDAGAFDGDTLLPFTDRFFEQLACAIGIEPDQANYKLLETNLDGAPMRIKNKTSIANVALGAAKGVKRFAGGKLQDSAICESGNATVRTISVEDMLRDRRPPSNVYLKLDIEGAEREAIIGARSLIKSSALFLAVSLYHKPKDLWELPRLVHSFNPGYRFCLRSHGEDGADLTAYAYHESLVCDLPDGLGHK